MAHEDNDDHSALLKIWSLYSSERLEEAQQELAIALAKSRDDFELIYLHALIAKKSGDIIKAIEAFQNIIEIADEIKDETRRVMLKRMASSHISHLTSGRWSFEQSNKDGSTDLHPNK